MNELRCSPEDEKYKLLNRFAQSGLDSLADGLKLHPDRTRRRGQESGVSVLVCNSTWAATNYKPKRRPSEMLNAGESFLAPGSKSPSSSSLCND